MALTVNKLDNMLECVGAFCKLQFAKKYKLSKIFQSGKNMNLLKRNSTLKFLLLLLSLVLFFFYSGLGAEIEQ